MPKIDPDDPMVRTAVFGKQVELFLQSDIGNYLLERAKDKKESAIEDLKSANPFDAEAMMRIRNEIFIADMFMDWLAEAIQLGRESKNHLEMQ